jgi:hypothetical protein
MQTAARAALAPAARQDLLHTHARHFHPQPHPGDSETAEAATLFEPAHRTEPAGKCTARHQASLALQRRDRDSKPPRPKRAAAHLRVKLTALAEIKQL